MTEVLKCAIYYVVLPNIISKFTWFWHLKNTFDIFTPFFKMHFPFKKFNHYHKKKLLVIIYKTEEAQNEYLLPTKYLPSYDLLYVHAYSIILCGHPNALFPKLSLNGD